MGMNGIADTNDQERIGVIDRLLGFDKAKNEWGKTGEFSITEINNILASTYREGDFNAFKAPFETYRDFREAVKAANRALNDPDAPWLTYPCECGGTITLVHREVVWRQKVGIGFPCMCQDCVDRTMKILNRGS